MPNPNGELGFLLFFGLALPCIAVWYCVLYHLKGGDAAYDRYFLLPDAGGMVRR